MSDKYDEENTPEGEFQNLGQVMREINEEIETGGGPHLDELRRYERKFRKGCAHGAAFMKDEAKRLLNQRGTAPQIVSHMIDLQAILQDWRERDDDLPEGNPWDWSYPDLEATIARRNEERSGAGQ